VLAALAGGLAGLAAIYVKGPGNGNANAECGPAVVEAKRLDPLIHGEIAAFLPASRPLSLADLSFRGPNGSPMSVGDFGGRTVLLNLWATWCVPCREEFPDLVRLEAAYRDKGLAVLGVSTDLGKDLSAVEKFLATHKPGFPNYHKAKGGDDQVFIESVDEKWGGELPFTVLYGRDGRKADALSGKHSYADFEREISRLLK
jgi:thiol-disulfide isomerase/thioredoxin